LSGCSSRSTNASSNFTDGLGWIVLFSPDPRSFISQISNAKFILALSVDSNLNRSPLAVGVSLSLKFKDMGLNIKITRSAAANANKLDRYFYLSIVYTNAKYLASTISNSVNIKA
jgi:hypothetical protein